jgi:centromere protein C
MAKESVMVRGKRSGTYVNTKDVEQDASGKDKMEDFFGAATEEPTPQSQRVKTRRKKRSSRLAAKPRTPKSTVPMQLPGADQEDSDLNSEQALNYTQSYVAKLKSTKSIQSPSELSAVSTAPPTPHDPAVEAPRFADEEQEERLHTQEELVVPQAASLGNQKILSVENPPQPIDGSQDPNFPPMGLEDDDNLAPAGHSEDEFDMGPAAHSDDDEEVDDTKPKAAETTSETESDFDNDEDKEGTGFNIVHDPETPASVRKRRMQKEKAEIEKRRKNKKRSSSSTSSNSGDSSQGDEEHTPVRKQTKRKKKQRHVVFSPQGIPMANRDYNPIPVENFVEVDEDEEGFRRSRRAKCKPLAYWKNEKFEYGPNGEIGELGEAMGDMPVVVNVVKALPTPYKKKTTTSKRKVNTKKQKQEKEEAEAFDNHKIVKKYKDKVIEGEHADLWDDAADDVVTLSKLLLS